MRARAWGALAGLVLALLTIAALEPRGLPRGPDVERASAALRARLDSEPLRALDNSVREFQDRERDLRSRKDLIERLNAGMLCGDLAFEAVQRTRGVQPSLLMLSSKRTLEVRGAARSARDVIDLGINLKAAEAGVRQSSYDGESFTVFAWPWCPAQLRPRAPALAPPVPR